MVFPTSTKDVSALVCFSQENSLDIAVRCGGHSPNGASSTDGGVCIDLSQMQAVSVDSSTNYVTVQGGALWQDIYIATGKCGVALVGGICGNVGVGGSGLMGGYGWLTGAHGLAVDNIVKAEIVLADGSLVTASAAENPDLYWAIRGAGPCFGIATSLVFQGYNQGSVWNGELVYPLSALPAVVEFMNHLLAVSKGESSALFMIGMLPGMTDPALVVQVYYDGTESQAKEFFAPLLKLGPTEDNTKVKPFSGTTGGGDDAPPGRGEITGGCIMAPIDALFLESLVKDYLAFTQKVPDASETIMAFETHPTYGISRHTQTETAFPNRGMFGNAIIFAKYTNEETAPACKEWCRAIHDKIRKEFERRRMADDVDELTKTAVGEYINYDGELYLRFDMDANADAC